MLYLGSSKFNGRGALPLDTGTEYLYCGGLREGCGRQNNGPPGRSMPQSLETSDTLPSMVKGTLQMR